MITLSFLIRGIKPKRIANMPPMVFNTWRKWTQRNTSLSKTLVSIIPLNGEKTRDQWVFWTMYIHIEPNLNSNQSDSNHPL